MRFKGVFDNIFKLEVGADNRTVERILQYTGRVSYEEPSLEESREWIQRLYHICEENVVGKVVNVGTVGHIDHGTRGYAPDMDDISWSTPHVKSYYNSLHPECIYWWEGLIYVGGRIIHNLRIHEVNNRAAGGTEEGLIVAKPDIDCDSITDLSALETNQFKDRIVARLNKGAGKTMPPEISKAIEAFLSPQPMKVQPAFIEREFERDRRTVIPTRKAIAWAIQLMVWNDDAMKKLAGVGRNDVYVRYVAPPFPGSKHDKLTDEGKWDA